MYTKAVKKIHYCHINVCDYAPPTLFKVVSECRECGIQ